MRRSPRWKINASLECPNCHEKKMMRNELIYRIIVPLFIVSAGIIMPILRTDNIPTWLSKTFLALVVVVFFAGFCTIGYYEFHDPQHTYKCGACGLITNIPRQPYSKMEKIIFGFFVFAISLFVLLLGALFVSLTITDNQ